MPSFSDAATQDVSQRVINSSQNIATKTADLVEELCRKLARFVHRVDSRSYSPGSKWDKGAGYRVLGDYAAKGGQIKTDYISARDAAKYEELLKYHGIPYICSTVTDAATGETRNIFMTRECDKQVVDLVRDDHIRDLRAGIMEIPYDHLLQDNSGKTIMTREGLSEAQVEVFRRHAADFQDLRYSVTVRADGNYDLSYAERHAGLIDQALKKTVFDLSGEQGEIYEKNINESLDAVRDFQRMLTPADGESLYIVDSMCPGRFIEVDSEHYTTHFIHEVVPEGETQGELIDDMDKPQPTGDLDSLYDAACSLYKPVILTKEEMGLLIKDINDHEVELATYDPSEFRLLSGQFLDEVIAGKNKFDYHHCTELLSNADNPKTVLIPEELQDKILSEIERNNLYRVVLVGDHMAGAGADRYMMNEILSKTLYAGVTGGALIEQKVRYEERGQLEIHNPEKTQYIIDLNSPYCLRLNSEGLDIMRDDKVTHHIDRTSPGFLDAVSDMCLTGGELKDIVVLSEEEFNSPDRDEMINEHNPACHHHHIKSMVFDRQIQERDGFVNGECLSERQQEANVQLLNLPVTQGTVRKTRDNTYQIEKTHKDVSGQEQTKKQANRKKIDAEIDR